VWRVPCRAVDILGTSTSIYRLKIHVVTPKLCCPSDIVYIVCLLISHAQ